MAQLETSDPLDGAARSQAARILSESKIYVDAGGNRLVQLTNEAELAKTTDWDVIFSAEAELIRQLPDADLQRRAWMVYDRYAEVAGTEKAARRAAAAASLKVDPPDPGLLRADVLQVHNETARHYMTSFQVERERAELTRFVIYIGVVALVAFGAFIGWPFFTRNMSDIGMAATVAGLLLAIVVVALFYRRYHAKRRATTNVIAMLSIALVCSVGAQAQQAPTAPTAAPAMSTTTQPQTSTADEAKKIEEAKKVAEAKKKEDEAKRAAEAKKKADEKREADEKPLGKLPIVPLVMLAGVLGATFSILQRVQRSTAPDPLVALFSLRAAKSQIYLSIVSGAIAALVVFAVFGGGMLQGALFPKIVNAASDEKGSAMMKLVTYLQGTGPLTHFDYGKLLVWAFIAGFAERFIPDILDKFTASVKE